MFKRSDCENINFTDNNLSIYRGLFSTSYNQFAFKDPDFEEAIIISRAPKLERDNGLHFWLAAVLQDDWSDRKEYYYKSYILEAEFKDISEEKFITIVHSCCTELITKPMLPLSTGKFISAMSMHSIETELLVDLYAEYENEYLHFYWTSTT